MQTRAIFFDGQSATDRDVTARLDGSRIIVTGVDGTAFDWTLAGLHAVDPHLPGRPFRLTHEARPGARLVIADEAFATALLDRAPALRGGFNPRRAARALAWILAGVAVVTVAAYVVLQAAPQRIATLLPDQWRNSVGRQIEASLTAKAQRCDAAAGRTALAAIAARIAEGNPDMPPVAVTVYAIPVANAFAMPGGRIVLTGQLIAEAESPEEVAGVLAHELGHVAHRHPEAQIVRATGLQVLIALVTGGGGGDTVSSLAGLAAILRYSRGAESEVDSYAADTMAKSAIDPAGLRQFFERVLKTERKDAADAFDSIEGAFATHPGTEERIKTIPPLPDGVTARPVLTAAQWQGLKAICK